MSNTYSRPSIPYTPDASRPYSNRYELITQNKTAPTSSDLDGDFNYLIFAANDLYDQIQAAVAGVLPDSDKEESKHKFIATNGEDPATLFWTQVTEHYLSDLCIPTRSLKDGCATAIKLGEGCVNSNKILPLNVLREHIANSAINSSKVENGSLSFIKFGDDEDPHFTPFFNGQEDNVLQGSKLLDNTTNGSKILDNSIPEPKYATDSIGRRALAPLVSIPVGAMMYWTTVNEPPGWLFANGQAVSRAKYSELFALYGESYGQGDGSTTFNLPDVRGRVIVSIDPDAVGSPDSTASRVTHTANNPYLLGGNGGEELHTLTTAEIPAHGHEIPNIISAGSVQPSGAYTLYQPSGATQTGNAGGGQSHNNMPPYILEPAIIYAGVI